MNTSEFVFLCLAVAFLYACLIGWFCNAINEGVYTFFKEGRQDSFWLWWGLFGAGFSFLCMYGLTLGVLYGLSFIQ